MKNLKLAMFMYKRMNHCSKAFDVYQVNSRRLLENRKHWKSKQKKKEDLKVPKVDKINCAKTMGAIMLHLQLIKGMQGDRLVYVVRQHVKVSHILPGYIAYLNLDKEMIARASIIHAKSNQR